MLFKKNKAVIASVLAGAMALQMVAVTGISASAKVDPLDHRDGCDTTVENKYGDSTYADRFMSLYDDVITNGVKNGYMSEENTISGGLGIPYHAAEEVNVEAPDYGHETTSEAMSYLVWVAAMHDNIVKNAADFKHEGNYSGEGMDTEKAWKTLEVMIPSYQPDFMRNASKLSATFSQEDADVKNYPFGMDGGVTASNPIATQFTTYGDEGLYLLHWLADVDDWYGFGGNNSSGKAEKNAIAEGTKSFVFINTFQRGESESCWETVPFACVETKQFGDSQKGIKGGIFNTDTTVADQYSYTNAPDAEDRAIQAVYAANRWGVGSSDLTAKAAKMGDETRNNMFDKYYKKIGCQNRYAETGLSGQHFLMSWYTSWGGATDGSWAWQIGASHMHEFYQNPLAAYALLDTSSVGLNSGMKNSQATSDFEKSLVRQVEFYEWLQSSDGMFAGGCTNMYKGTYASYSEDPNANSTFYDMLYVEHPVYADPGSNHWIGNQVWATQRLAELYYYLNQDGAKDYKLSDGSSMKEAIGKMLDKWVAWFNENTILGKATQFESKTYMYDGVETTNDKLPVLSSVVDDGKSFSIPASLIWNGAPDKWDPQAGPTGNSNLTCEIVGYGSADIGCVSSLANTLIYYAKAKGVDSSAALTRGTSTEDQALYIAKQLLDRAWAQGRDEIGVSIPDTNGSFTRFWTAEIWIPTAAGSRQLPNGDTLKNGVTFIETRSNYKKIAKFQDMEKYYQANGNTSDYEVNFHRFWHEGDMLVALGTLGMLYNDLTPGDSEEPETTESTTAEETTVATTAEDTTESTTAEDTTAATTAEDTTAEDTTAATKESVAGVTLWGDVNVDSKVSIADVVLFNKYLVKTSTVSEQGVLNSDCWYDQSSSAEDSLAILKLVVGTYTQTDMPLTPAN